MPTISFANPKGGAGKTTSALLLATELAGRGAEVVVIDADPERWKNCPDMMDCDPWTPPAPEPEEEAETRNA